VVDDVNGVSHASLTRSGTETENSSCPYVLPTPPMCCRLPLCAADSPICAADSRICAADSPFQFIKVFSHIREILESEVGGKNVVRINAEEQKSQTRSHVIMLAPHILWTLVDTRNSTRAVSDTSLPSEFCQSL